MAFPTIFTIIFLGVFSTQTQFAAGNFYKYYNYLWGTKNFKIDPQGNQVQLIMDRSSGAGFKSKLEYGSGLFHIRMKIPERKTGGIVTSFYLTSAPDYQDPSINHFELDFEFLGTNGILQTNVYDNDGGHREQSFKLWFDPCNGFHSYEILWSSRIIVFRIDNIPVRVFRNNKARGIDYPVMPMHIESSIWNVDWAGVVDWSRAPFIASYTDFDFNACPARGPNIGGCASPALFWNQPRFWDLNAKEKNVMAFYRKRYMSYDYCSNPSTRKPECSLNN